MGVIVDGGRRIPVVPARGHGGPRPVGTPRRTYTAVSKTKQSPAVRMTVWGAANIQRVEENLAVVRSHFGTNIAEALRTAVHLTAQAIRNNKALPDVAPPSSSHNRARRSYSSRRAASKST